MANIVSIEWSVEDFRRLISEPSQLSEAELPITKTVDVVSIEIAPSSKTRDGSLVVRQVEAVLREKNDLLGQKVVDEAATAEPGKTPTLEVNGNQATFHTALEITDFEFFEKKPGYKSSDETAGSSGVTAAITAFGIDERIASDEHLEADASGATEQPPAPNPLEAPSVDPAAPPSFFATARNAKPKSPPRQEAIVEPDSDAGRATHDTTDRLYRGVEYLMVKGALRDIWRWSVRVGQPEMLRMGEASTAQQAELDVRSVIDRAITVEETLRRLKRRDSAN
jgi:hypothetical protein